MKSAVAPDRFFHFVCRAPRHLQALLFAADALSAPSPITIHDSRWSYCPLGARDGHDWVPTQGGETLEEVKRDVQRDVLAHR